jgi:hypothetical protein
VEPTSNVTSKFWKLDCHPGTVLIMMLTKGIILAVDCWLCAVIKYAEKTGFIDHPESTTSNFDSKVSAYSECTTK